MRLRIPNLLLPLLLALGAAACGTLDQNKQDAALDATLRSYAATMRWGDENSFEQAAGFISPADLEAHPIPHVEMERYHQVRIVGYQEQGLERPEPNIARQTVTLQIVNQHTQLARSILDHQEWHYDPVTKHWWLTSGLPKLTADDGR